MSDFKSILEDSENYFKFHSQYKKYPLYTDEVGCRIETVDTDAVRNEIPSSKSPQSKTPAQKNETVYNTASNESNTETVSEGIVRKDEENYSLMREDWMDAESLDQLKEMISDCKKCRLWETRTNFVFGTGNPNADIVVVGEAPGAEEDKQGKPFIGRAGQLLTKILKAIDFEREDVFICNILKSRPPENRNPMADEIAKCEPYLLKQLELIKPKLILALGTFASQTLLQVKEPLGKLRGRFHDYNGIKMMVTYHPAALLRNPNWKKPAWEDVQLLRAEYDKLVK